MPLTTEEIKSLSKEEKIELMGKLWDDLINDDPNPDIPPEHRKILAKRMKNIEDGRASFRPWSRVRSKYLQ